MGYSEHTIQQLRAHVQLSNVVRQKVQLVKKGYEHLGLCPFHNEKTPSFTVNDQKEFYHCFGCGAHGDVFDFLMSVYGLSFQDALERAAQISGFVLPEPIQLPPEKVKQQKNIIDLYACAAAWYQSQLFSEEAKYVLSYLEKRHISQKYIQKYKIGFSPKVTKYSAHPLEMHLLSQGFSKNNIIDSGLLLPSKFHDGCYDRLEGRLLFPITNRKGQVIAFGGRVLDNSQPKYLNSAENDIFQKRDTLYNYFLAKEAVQKEQKPLIVVEGYMDVIAMDMHGFPQAVAPLGTAFTESHLQWLWRVSTSHSPLVCFDGDQAGFNAAIRVAELALPHLSSDKNIRFCLLPMGEDPDSYLAKYGRERFQELLNSSYRVFDILWKVEKWQKSTENPEDVAQIDSSLNKKFSTIQDPFLKKQYLQFLKRKVFQLSWQKKGKNADQGPKVVPLKFDSLERKFVQALLCALIHHPDVIEDFLDPLSQVMCPDSNLESIKQKIIDYILNKDLDIWKLKDHLKESGEEKYLHFDASVMAIAPFIRKDTQKDEVRQGIEMLLKSLSKEQWHQDIAFAESQLAHDMSEKNFQYLLNLKKEYGES